MADRPTKHRTLAVDVDALPPHESRTVSLPWWSVAVGGTVAVLAAAWLLMAGGSALGWLTSPDTELDDALRLGTNMFLLAHGCAVMLGGQLVSLMPLGLTLILVVLAQPVAALAARQAAGSMAPADDTGRMWVNGEAVVMRVAGTMALTHGLVVGVVAAALEAPGGFIAGLIGGVVLGAVSGLWGASRGVGFDPRRSWPVWLRSVPYGLGWALLVCVVGGATALVSTMISQRDRIMFIHEGLDPGIVGTILLVLIQLLYLPNLVLWATSWTLGAGVTLGDDSLLSLSVTDAGFLPAIPVLGAVGEPGLGGGLLFWWLAVGVVAGLIAALVVGLARPRARADETALVGGLAGVLAGLLVTLFCALAGGGLGDDRLAFMGPDVGQLMVVAPVLLGLSGLVGGAVLGLVRRPPKPERSEPPAAHDPAEKPDDELVEETAEVPDP